MSFLSPLSHNTKFSLLLGFLNPWRTIGSYDLEADSNIKKMYLNIYTYMCNNSKLHYLY